MEGLELIRIGNIVEEVDGWELGVDQAIALLLTRNQPR